MKSGARGRTLRRWIVLVMVPVPGALSAPTASATEPTDPAAEAAATGEPVVIPGLTTATTEVVVNPDGTYTANIASGPVRVPDGNAPSGWAPIDLTLQHTDAGIEPAVADADITFSDGGTDPMATLATDTDSYQVGWNGTLPAPILSGAQATYPDVVGGVDLELEAQPDGYQMRFVVPAPPTTPLS